MNFSSLSTMLLALALSSVCLFFVSHAQQPSGNAPFSALFAFGDSILDTGNNNYILTASKCNFFPYGRNFAGGRPTGRFGNGRVFSDIITDGLGIKNLLPAFRDPFLSNDELPTGVCFASGGSGLDQGTYGFQNVIGVPDQVKDFQNYVGRLNNVVGSEKANAIISNAVFLISAGNNDLAISFPTRGILYGGLPGYTDQLVRWTNDLLKSLYDMGARKFAVMGTLPLGCLPAQSALIRMCSFPVNQLANVFNQKLSANLDNLGTTYPGAKFAYVDMYNSLLGVINNPLASGFIDTVDGCVITSPIPCLDASTYVFWDYAHPTEKAYQTIAPPIVEELKEKLA